MVQSSLQYQQARNNKRGHDHIDCLERLHHSGAAIQNVAASSAQLTIWCHVFGFPRSSEIPEFSSPIEKVATFHESK
jgi:hypothetical protein